MTANPSAFEAGPSSETVRDAPNEQSRAGPATLVHLAQRSAPPGAIVEYLDLPKRVRLRVARWLPAQARGTVFICTGRGEFIEKYFEVCRDLLDRGLAIVVFDWRGQGLSSRALHDPRKGHVDSFAEFDADLQAVVDRVLALLCPRPFFALAHSMGGTVMIRHARGRHCAFERIVLSAPMVEIRDLPFGPMLRPLAGVLATCGFGTSFVPRGRRTAVLENGFPGNVLTSDPNRFAEMVTLSRAEPRLTIDAPTVGWLRAALDAMAPMAAFDYPARIATPILMVVPGADRVVSSAAMERFGQRLKAGTVVAIPGARHEILMERDELRDRFWAAFDAFIPGTAASSVASTGRDRS